MAAVSKLKGLHTRPHKGRVREGPCGKESYAASTRRKDTEVLDQGWALDHHHQRELPLRVQGWRLKEGDLKGVPCGWSPTEDTGPYSTRWLLAKEKRFQGMWELVVFVSRTRWSKLNLRVGALAYTRETGQVYPWIELQACLRWGRMDHLVKVVLYMSSMPSSLQPLLTVLQKKQQDFFKKKDDVNVKY